MGIDCDDSGTEEAYHAVVSTLSRGLDVTTNAHTRGRRQLDGAWISAWIDRDADYPDLSGPPMGRIFMNRDTGEFVEVVQETGAPCVDSWLEIPIPGHRQHHKWFRAFLSSIGCEDEYRGSIGRWLNQYGSDVRFRMWSAFRSERVVDYVIATCRRAGIDAEVV